MLINGYEVRQYQSGDYLLGYRQSPAGTYVFSGIAGSAQYSTSVDLSMDQITNLGAGVDLLPLLNADGDELRYYDVVQVRLEFTAGTDPYVCNEFLYLTGCVEAAVQKEFLQYSVPDSPVITIVNTSISTVTDMIAEHRFFARSQGLLLSTQGVSPTGGNGAMRVVVLYNIQELGS